MLLCVALLCFAWLHGAGQGFEKGVSYCWELISPSASISLVVISCLGDLGTCRLHVCTLGSWVRVERGCGYGVKAVRVRGGVLDRECRFGPHART